MRAGSFALAGAVALLSGVLVAKPHAYSLPEDAVPAELSDTDGALVVNNCSACHSLEYIVTQPRGKGAQFWKDSVAKMVAVYKAPLDPGDTDAVAAVLAKKFG
jgi:mono/diheme cytochrome c family protein